MFIQRSSVRGNRGSCGVSLQPQKGLILDVQKGKSLSSTGHRLCLHHLQLRAPIPCGEQPRGTNNMCTFCLSSKHFVFQLKGWGCEDSSEAITAWGQRCKKKKIIKKIFQTFPLSNHGDIRKISLATCGLTAKKSPRSSPTHT